MSKIKLSFEDSVLTSESEETKPHTYRAKVLRGIDIVLKETLTGTPVKKFECSSYEQAVKLAKKLNKQAVKPFELIELEKYCRKCSVTHEAMDEGWITENTDEYFKYEQDALNWCKQNGYKSIKQAYKDEAIYWTEWQDDYHYIVKKGVLTEIEN
jgi:hypothetical protein